MAEAPAVITLKIEPTMMWIFIQNQERPPPLVVEGGNRISAVFGVLLAVLCFAVSAKADLIQHLDATISSSVILSGNTVTQWKDQSGMSHHATKKDGTVTYPSMSTFASGKTGLKFGPSYSSMTLFPSDSWLNQTSGNGFCVLIAFKVDAIDPGGNNDVLGNDDAINSGALGLRYSSDGTMSASLGKIVSNKSDQRVTAGDTMVYAVNYNPMTGMFEFWDSKNYDSLFKKVWPGNFSVGQAVVLGYAGHTGRILNGLVGEVKIYNSALGADLFKAEREAMATKWANLANMAEINWRVIPENPDYPTDDIITSAISVADTNLINQLPADPANTDCTATFQEAIDTVCQANGGTVWIPEGEYRFDNNLFLRDGVSLRGRWARPSTNGVWNTGTVLKIYHGEGDPDGAPFITSSGSGNRHIKDLTFWHPNQSPTDVKSYPYVILALGGTYENLTFVNAYRGINQDAAGFGLIRGMYGTLLETGLMSDHGAAVPRFDSLYASPAYWDLWPLGSYNVVANPEQPGNYAHFMMNTGTFFRIQNQDVFSFYNADISGYSVGLVMENSDGSSLSDGNVPNHGQVSGVNIHDCQIALHAKTGNFSSGLKSTFSGSQYGIYSTTGGNIPLTECVVSGGVYAVYSQGSSFGLNARSCQIAGTVRFEKGNLELKACNFTRPGTHVSVISGIGRGIVAGCTYDTNQQVTIVGSSHLDEVDHTPLNYKPLPDYKINPLTDFDTVRKPAKTNLYNVSAYGAKGDGKTDDTAAVTAAVNAAKSNGGGIVFFPFGDFGRYRITGNLNLGTGVELRGIGTRGPPTEYKSQSIIQIEKSGPADGTPFITMGDHCGVRGGLVFWYPQNNWDRILNGGESFTPYPYTIYANGTNNYVIACTTPNPYQFVDFNGATNPLVDMMLTGGLRTVYRVRGGTTGCRIMTGHIKPSGMWGLLTDITNNKYNYTLFGQETTKTVEIFDLDDCEDLMILGMFCREAHKALTCNGAQGMIVGTAGEAVQNGFCFERAGAKPLYMIDTKPNMSEHGTGTGKPGILVEPTYNSSLDILGGAEQGAADYKFKALSGNVYSQSRKNVNSGWAQLREVYVGGTAQLTLYDNILDKPFSLHVESSATLKLERSYLPAGMPYATIDGSLVITKSDINQNCILSVPGQTQFSEHGLILDRSNTTRVTNNWSYSEKLTSGDSFNLNVTEPAFSNSKVQSIDVSLGIYPGSSGTNTISVYYDSTTGEKLAITKTFAVLDGGVEVVGFSVNDARFGSSTSDIRIQLGDPSIAAGLSYISVRGNPAIQPPFDLTAKAGPGSISLDWKGMSHWQFGSYNVYRSTVSGGPYTRIATDLTATAFTDNSVASNIASYYIVKTVDSSGNETSPSSEVMATATPRYSFYTYTGGTGSWETSGQWSSGAAWNGPFSGTLHVPSPIDDMTLGLANVTLNSTTTLDEYRVGDGGASPSGAGILTLNPGSVLHTRQGSVGYNRNASLTILSGAQMNHSADVVIGYRGRTTVDVHGTLTQRDLKLQYILANPRPAASVISVHNGGIIDVSRNLQIGGDDGTANFTGLSGTLNIHTGGLVRALGWDLRKGALVVIDESGQLKIDGDQRTVAASYIASGYITSAALISVIYDVVLDETLISAAEPASGYNVWASTNGVGNATVDDDGDGWANLLEYALGGNPHSGSDAAPATEMMSSSLKYSYKKRNDDFRLTYVLQGCADLKTWRNLDPVGIIDSTNGNYDHVSHTIPVDESPYFIRLKVNY